ncbi:S-layer homology domain-containing protein [Lysinibacillus pakistanensis]|uniref:S-layer homology domain-containing protein n=1 Tax=Lysinibacillus pakistanensis TaxID=759811 RepID=UPI003D2C0CF5
MRLKFQRMVSFFVIVVMLLTMIPYHPLEVRAAVTPTLDLGTPVKLSEKVYQLSNAKFDNSDVVNAGGGYFTVSVNNGVTTIGSLPIGITELTNGIKISGVVTDKSTETNRVFNFTGNTTYQDIQDVIQNIEFTRTEETQNVTVIVVPGLPLSDGKTSVRTYDGRYFAYVERLSTMTFKVAVDIATSNNGHLVEPKSDNPTEMLGIAQLFNEFKQPFTARPGWNFISFIGATKTTEPNWDSPKDINNTTKFLSNGELTGLGTGNKYMDNGGYSHLTLLLNNNDTDLRYLGVDNSHGGSSSYLDPGVIVELNLGATGDIITANKNVKQSLETGPAGIANPHLWLRADKNVVANAGKVETWEDQSENGHDFTQVDANKQPVLNDDSKRLNFNKAVTFNGSSSYLVKEGGVLGGQSYNNFNVFAVAGIGHLAQNSLFWENIKGSGGRLNVHLPYGNTVYWDAGSQASERVYVPSPITLGHYYTWNFNYGTSGTVDSGQSIYRDGKETVLATNRSKAIEGDANQNMFLGSQSATNGFYKGQVGELIFYSKPLTATDRQKVNSYLAIKYGISLDMIDYLAADGTTWWSADATYNYNIAGIALDDAGSLHQRQSRSVNDTSKLTIGIGTTLLPKNEEDNRNGDLTNGQALVWGSNDKALNFTQSIAGKDMKHSERVWKVQNTGNVGQVTIAIPKNVVSKDKLSLLIGADSANFTAATPIQMTEMTFDGEAYFVAQATLANDQYFTFAADVPVPQSVKVEEITVNQNQIVVTFDKDIKLTAPEATGFTVTVGTETITLTNADIKVDPVNPKQLLITLPAGTDTTGKSVKVAYDGQGNLTGTNNVPVNAFEKELTIVDKTALGNKITEVEGITEKDYTPDSWTALQNELTKAKAIFDNPSATQTEVNEALTNLTKAKDNLVHVKPKPETAVLEQTAGANKVAVTFDKNIQVTDLAGFAITVDGTEVTPTGFEVVGDKLVLTFPNNPDVTDKAVKVKYDGTGNLQGTNGAAIEQFELPVEDPYSAAFQITKPDAVTANPQPTIGGKVDVTTTPSTVTIVLKNDKDEPVLVDVAAIVDPTTGEWTFTPPTDLPDGTYTIIATATNGQQTVTKKHTFTVATTPIVNKVPLQQKVEEAKNLVAGEYTPASWAQYQVALKKANEVLTDPNATQEEVDKALAALTGAQNALVKIGKVGKGLGTLNPSTGTLSPSFQTGVTDYTMTVGYSTSVIDFTAIPVEAGATVTTTVNGQPGAIGQIPLQVGENIIVISVKDANGNVRQYTIKVYRDAYTGGGSWTPNPAPPVTPTPGDTKTKIQVELEIDGEKPLEKTTVEIERTKHANGDITDFVALTEANVKEAVAKAKEIGNNIARIVLPDVNDEVKEAKVEIPKESLKLLRDNGLSLEISSENGHIAIPVSSMEGIDDNFYFRLVPVKKESERQAIEERARAERVVRATLQSNDVHVVARPMTIETNMPNRPVQVTLPLKGVKIPTDATEREAFLKQLAVFIEHSDGEKKVVIPEVVTMAKGELGLRFTVEKFSTFTIIQVNKKAETKPPLEVKEHEAYIKGFPDGTFGPEKNVTRAQVATMIARILGYTDSTTNTAPFKDIPSDHYAAGAIAFVKERGIMNGDVNGNFRASENITRAQMATVVANFKQLSIEENVAITFNDTKGHWAQWIIEANRAAGIINGRQDGSFAPDEHLTRAQAVVMMNRMFERGPLQGVTTTSFPDVKATHWAFEEIEEAAKSHSYVINEDDNEQLSK